jgi:hypothetical protein
MKKIILVGTLALFALASTQQQAPAWLNFKFGVGLNWAWQSGGNNFLWGLYRNGQPPGFGPQYDPSVLRYSEGCGPGGPFVPAQQGGACTMQPHCPQMLPGANPACPQFPPAPFQPQSSSGQSGYPYFPGMYPYTHDQFQYFGSAPGQPNIAGDAGSQTVAYPNRNLYATAQMQNPSQNWSNYYRGAAQYPYSASSYYPSTSYYPSSSNWSTSGYQPSYYPNYYGYQQPYPSQSYYGYRRY